MTRFYHTLHVELTVEVEFDVDPGSAATSVDPAEDALIENGRMHFALAGQEIEVPDALYEHLLKTHYDELLASANESVQSAKEDAADARRDRL